MFSGSTPASTPRYSSVVVLRSPSSHSCALVPSGGRTHAAAQRAATSTAALGAADGGSWVGVSAGTGGSAVRVGVPATPGPRPSGPGPPPGSVAPPTPVRAGVTAAIANVAPTTRATTKAAVTASRSGERSGHVHTARYAADRPCEGLIGTAAAGGDHGLVRPGPVDPVDGHAVDDLRLHRADATRAQRHRVGPAVDHAVVHLARVAPVRHAAGGDRVVGRGGQGGA